MKRFNGIALSVAFCSLASQAALAQTKIDTLKVQNLNEVNLLAELKKRLKISIFLWRKSCASR